MHALALPLPRHPCQPLQIKSPNVLLARDGTAKISDVGMVRAGEGRTCLRERQDAAA